MEHEKLDEYLRELEGVITDEELFHLLMVALEEKPGGLVMDPDCDAVSKLEASLDELGIDHRVMGQQERGLLDRLLGRDRRFGSNGFFFTKDSSRFEILDKSEGEFYGCSGQAVGKFLGYPERSVIYYSESSKMGMETVGEIKEKFEDLELKYLALVSYIPSPDRKQVENAVEKGKKRSELVEKAETPSIGPELRNRLIEESHWT